MKIVIKNSNWFTHVRSLMDIRQIDDFLRDDVDFKISRIVFSKRAFPLDIPFDINTRTDILMKTRLLC